MKAYDKDGNEMDVYSAEEHTAGISQEVEKVKGEFVPKITNLETELGQVKTALNERAGEFKNFHKLHDDVVAKLTVAERTIYENQLAAEKRREADEERVKKDLEIARDNAIKKVAGADEKLFKKMQDMWGIIGIEATTAEQIEQKTKMIVGAIGSTEPDLVASVVGFSGGSFAPPKTATKEGESFADTPRGAAAMDELGLKIPEKK